MTEERWERLVRKLDRVAAEKPRGYRVRVGLLAGLGYGYLLLVVALLLAGVAAIVMLGLSTVLAVLKFAWPLLVLAFLAVRSLWFRIPPPEGLELTRSDAPELWRVVDEVRGALDAPKVHHLLVDDELNAGVVQVPRLGPVGPQRNYLLVGLPLMQALSQQQFTAVLAHEFGHLSGNHSRFAGYIYRLRRTYAQLLATLEERSSAGVVLFRRFFEWYAPYFSAYSFALARQDEYVADGAAAEVAGQDASAAALVRVNLTARWLGSRYWPEVHGRVEKEAEAPRTAFTTLRERLPLQDAGDLQSAVEVALDEPTGIADTHPGLGDRLKALAVTPDEARRLAAAAPERSAAAALLGDLEAELVAHFDARWLEDVGPAWQERHEEVARDRERYEALSAAGPASLDDRLELVALTYRFAGAPEALPLARDVLAEHPDAPAAEFWSGVTLLETGDGTGLAHLDRAMELDRDATIPACEHAIDFLLAHDREQEAERYLERGREHAARLEAARAERDDVSEEDELIPHGLPEGVTEGIRRTVARERGVKRSYLVRKVVDDLNEEIPLYILALQLERRPKDEPDEIVRRVLSGIQIDGEILVITLGGKYKPLRRKLAAVLHSELAPS